MTFKQKSAVYALNSYVWKLLESNLDWEPVSYTDKDGETSTGKSIIPTAQMPELMTSGEPFLVYGSAVHPPGHLYAQRKEAVSYVIYGGQSVDVNNIVALFVKTFERQDEAAADVNEWLDTENKGRNITFHTITLSMTNNAEPSEDEGGYVSALVILELIYTENNNDIITSGFTA